MTQSKQEVAQRLARIRAEKLRENLGRRKQQLRQRANETVPDVSIETNSSSNEPDEEPG